MTAGIRLRGSSGNVQIDDSMPVHVVRERGTYGPANYVRSNVAHLDFDAYYTRYVVVFATPVTSYEAPLVFLQLNTSATRHEVYMSAFQVEGSPGYWTGFSIAMGRLYSSGVSWHGEANDQTGSWFSCTPCPGASAATRGIRIRNRLTGAVVWDTGWPLVKFKQQTANFVSEGRFSHGVLRYSVGYPAGSYFLANGFTGLIGSSGSSLLMMVIARNSSDLGKLFIYTLATTSDSDIPYQFYTWLAVFAEPGW
jgi:hypothetical protein